MEVLANGRVGDPGKTPDVSTITAAGKQSPIHAPVNEKKPTPRTSDQTSAWVRLSRVDKSSPPANAPRHNMATKLMTITPTSQSVTLTRQS